MQNKKTLIIYLFGYILYETLLTLYLKGYILCIEDEHGEILNMNPIAEFVKKSRKDAGLTQEEFAMRSGLGLRFVRDLEQGKTTVRMDKVNVALGMFGMEAAPARKEHK